MAIKIEFLAGIARFLRGTSDMGEALDDVADSLDDVARDAKKAGDKTGDAISDGAKDAEQGVERLGREFKEMADQARRSSDKAGDSLGRGIGSGTDAAKRDLAELKDEAVQNASETFSSFDGSMDSLVDGIQGTFGGIVSNMGAAGAVAGGALAIGIGYAVAQGQELADALNSAKERSAEIAGEILAADGDLSKIQWAEKFNEWGLAIEDNREWWEVWQAEAKTAMEVASESADRFGISVKDLALGLSGTNADAAIRSISALRDQIEELEDARSRAQQSTVREDLSMEIRGRTNLIAKLEAQSGVTEDAIRVSEQMASISAEMAAADEAAAAASQARTDATNALQRELDEAVNSWTAFYNAETGATDPAGYIAAMQDRVAATTNFNANLAQLAQETGMSFEAQQAILDQGVDFAPMLASIMAQSPEMRAQFAGQMQAMVDGGQSILDGTPINATITTTTDAQDAERQLDAAATERKAPVKAEADATAASQALDAAAAKTRTATIGVSVSTSDAEAALSRFVSRQRTATITAEVRTREGQLVP